MMKNEINENEPLLVASVSGCSGSTNEKVNECKHEYTTNYCNSDGSYSHTVCDDCFEIIEI
jgi:hypothetical protein